MHLFLILRNGSCVAKPYANIVIFESSDDEKEFADGVGLLPAGWQGAQRTDLREKLGPRRGEAARG
jgi:hypothetical protein